MHNCENPDMRRRELLAVDDYDLETDDDVDVVKDGYISYMKILMGDSWDVVTESPLVRHAYCMKQKPAFLVFLGQGTVKCPVCGLTMSEG